MWYLVNQKNGNKSIILLSNKKYKIGRLMQNNSNDVEIPIDADQTVSRLHAELFIKYEESQCTNLESIPSIILTDHSKFGTFVNDFKIEGFKNLKNNDTVRFGAYNSIYQLVHEPLIVTTSCLTSSDKSLVKKYVAKLNGHLINDWINECSFVIMESITITVKVIDALLCQKQIVGINFLKELIESSEQNKTAPDPKEFLPPIGEPSLKAELLNFEPCLSRKYLFKDKIFIFFTDHQLHKMQNIIELASGTCELFNKSIHLNLNELKKNINKFLFVQNINHCSNDLETKLESLLKNLKQKLIDESEIGLAVLYKNLQENCNPNLFDNNNTQKNEYKISSQTLTDTYYRANYDTQKTDTQLEETQTDSLMIQFENKVQDLFIITETPEKDRKRPLELKETQNIVPRQEEPLKQSPKQDDFEILKQDFNFKLEKSVKKIEKPVLIKKENLSLPQKIEANTSALNESKKDLVVYSKLKPPNESLLIKKSSDLNQTESIQPTIQAKIKYESLIVVKKEPDYFTNSSSGGKKNFKKFKKVPKASQLKKETSNLFKSFKQEPFDLDSQFHLFMSSNK